MTEGSKSMNAIALAGAAAGHALIPTSMEGAMRLAEMMSRGKLVPQHLRDSPGDCLMVVEQSMRWGMSPFAVAQCTSVIQGKLMFEGKLVSAALHSSGIMASRLEYEFAGSGDARTIIIRGLLKGEAQPRDVQVALKDAKTSNSLWVKQPDQQLIYHGTRVWARRHAPEVMLGVYSPEEMDHIPQPTDTFSGPTIEARAETPTPAAAPEPSRRKVVDILSDIERRFAVAIPQGRDAVDEVLASDDVQKALDKFTNGARARLDALIKDALGKCDAITNDPTLGQSEEAA